MIEHAESQQAPQEPPKANYLVEAANLESQELRNARIRIQGEAMQNLMKEFPDLAGGGERFNAFTTICRSMANEDMTLLPRFIDPQTREAAVEEVITRVRKEFHSDEASAAKNVH